MLLHQGSTCSTEWVLQDIQAAIAGMREAQQVAEARIAELEAMRREPRPALDDAQKSSASGAAAVQLPAESDMHRLAHALDVRERSLAQLEERLAQQQAQHAKVCCVSAQSYQPLLACSIADPYVHLLHKHHDALVACAQVEEALKLQLVKRKEALAEADKRFGEMEFLMRKISAQSGML